MNQTDQQEKFREKQRQITFSNGSVLLVEMEDSRERVNLLNPQGQLQLSLVMTSEGTEINLSGDIINLNARKSLNIKSPRISIKAEDMLSMESEGDIRHHAERDHFNTARIQYVKADLGNVNIKANDDVRIDGERVRLNCTD